MEPAACRRDVVVDLAEGLHFAPLRAISQIAARFSSEVAIHKGDLKVDAKSMFDLLTLMAEQGTPLVIEAHGEDAPEAVAAILRLFHSNFQDHSGSSPAA